MILSLMATIPLQIAIARLQYPEPQAILTLGGGPDREVFTAKFASYDPNLTIWVSSGTDIQTAQKIFSHAGIPADRYYLDRRAKDTVTNFTTLVQDFKKNQIKHLYLITSDFHILRAVAIATIVLGSNGIAFTPVTVPTDLPSEPIGKILRDTGRSLLWIFTGRTGSSLKELESVSEINL